MDFKPLVYDICRDYVSDQNSVLSESERKRILGWIRSRDIAKLASCRDHFPEALSNRELFRTCFQIEAFFKKNTVFDSEECKVQALKSFYRAEKLCRITNRRLGHYYNKRDRLGPDLVFWMDKVERRIDQVLGPIEPFIDLLPRLVRVTSGATASTPRRASLPAYKLTLKPAVTSRALPLLNALYQFNGFERVRPEVTNCNRVEIVTKNFKTGRTIACEPEGNTALQLAFDTYAKGRLRRIAKIDLSSQVQNQRQALEGSLSGEIATLDLTMASDTAAFNAVAWSFPTTWFNYLRDVRCEMGAVPRLRGSQNLRDGLAYAKFSSMGNGATFTIETLIFEACCYAVGSRDHKVYGDDITIAKRYYDDLVRLLRFLGFIPNEEKSFREGPFRESCGKNYFNGVDVTPFYLREWDLRKSVLSHNVNGLASIAVPEGQLWRRLRDLVAWFRLPLIPLGYDSTMGVFIDVPTSYRLGLIQRGKGNRKTPNPGCLYFKGLVPKGKRLAIRDTRGYMLWFLERNYIHNKQPCEVSLVTTSVHKYVRKWVRWNVPAVAAPVHIYMWTDYLTREC